MLEEGAPTPNPSEISTSVKCATVLPKAGKVVSVNNKQEASGHHHCQAAGRVCWPGAPGVKKVTEEIFSEYCTLEGQQKLVCSAKTTAHAPGYCAKQAQASTGHASFFFFKHTNHPNIWDWDTLLL